MKRTLLSICGFLLALNATPQTPAYEWLLNGGYPTEHGSAENTTVDKWGNTYLSGEVDGQTIFGSTIIEDSPFLAKYDPSGIVIWAQQIDQIRRITTDTLGFLYTYHVLGIDKYDESGNLVWSEGVNPTPSGGNKTIDIQTDNESNVYVCGQFDQGVTLDEGNEYVPNTLSSEEYQFYVAKYDSSGAFLWARNSGATGPNGNSINAATMSVSENNIVVSGSLENGAAIELTDTLIGSGYFILTYDQNGNYQWGLSDASTVSLTGGGSTTIDESDNIYLLFTSGASIINIDGTIYTENNGGSFLVKYDSSGGLNFVEQMDVDGISTNLAYANGRLYYGFGGYEMKVASYDTSGIFRWEKLSGSSSTGNPDQFSSYDIEATDAFVYLCGFFEGNWTIDGHSIVSGGTGISNNDFFAGKLNPNIVTFFDQKDHGLAIIVYPNPSSSLFQLTLPSELGPTPYTIYNNLGVVIKNGTTNISNQTLDLSNQPTGMYLLQIRSEDQLYTERLIKQ